MLCRCLRNWQVMHVYSMKNDVFSNVQVLFSSCSEKLRPMVNKGIPWSMDQFKRIYNSVRVPGEPKDILITPFKTGLCHFVSVLNIN